MIRRLVARIVRGCLAFFALLLMATALVAILSFRQPGFYAELRAQTFSPADQAAATQQLEQMNLAAMRWLELSLARQQAQQTAAPAPSGAGAPKPNLYDPRQDAHAIRITQQQLNAQFAAKELSMKDPWRRPRINIGQDTIELGVEVAAPSASAVLSIMLEPSLTDEGGLRLDIRAARIGSLTLPLHTILRCLPRAIVHSGPDADLDLTPPAPHLTVKLPKSGRRTPTIKAIECTPGEIVVTLLPPVLERLQGEGPPATTLSQLQ